MKLKSKFIAISLFASLIIGCVLWAMIYKSFPDNHSDVFMWGRRCMIMSIVITYIAGLIFKLDTTDERDDPEYLYSHGIISLILFDIAVIFLVGIPVLFVIQ